jgi:hypothetical protein
MIQLPKLHKKPGELSRYSDGLGGGVGRQGFDFWQGESDSSLQRVVGVVSYG